MNLLIISDEDDEFCKSISKLYNSTLDVKLVDFEVLCNQPWESNCVALFLNSAVKLNQISMTMFDRIKKFIETGGIFITTATMYNSHINGFQNIICDINITVKMKEKAISLNDSLIFVDGEKLSFNILAPPHLIKYFNIDGCAQSMCKYSENEVFSQKKHVKNIAKFESDSEYAIIAVHFIDKSNNVNGQFVLIGFQSKDFSPNNLELLVVKLFKDLIPANISFKNQAHSPIFCVSDNISLIYSSLHNIKNPCIYYQNSCEYLGLYKANSIVLLDSENNSLFSSNQFFDISKCLINVDGEFSQFGGNPDGFGKTILYSKCIDSTQTFLESNLDVTKNLPNGSILVASHQLAGRGRSYNKWISTTGCLQFTMILHRKKLGLCFAQNPVLEKETLQNSNFLLVPSLIQHLVALALFNAIKEFDSEIEIYIKWPNDICSKKGEKLGGVLVTDLGGENDTILIGIGINLQNEKFIKGLANLSVKLIGKEELLAKFTRQFSHALRVISIEKSFPYLEYYNAWFHNGQIVSIAGSFSQWIIVGIDNFGNLIAKSMTDPEEYKHLQSDGNSFDLTRNLIHVKF